MIQNQIKRTLSVAENLGFVQRLLAEDGERGRTEVADQVCAHFAFYDALGRVQRSGCLKALRELERGGHFQLPSGPARERRKPSPRRLGEAVRWPCGVPAEVGEIEGLQLIRVETDEQMLVWNELMAGEHPLGAGPLVGRQLRYLIGSAHGWLGGLGFAAAALHLADRDRGRSVGIGSNVGSIWIGWSG